MTFRRLKFILPAILLALLPCISRGQYYFRIECDISIKYKVDGGEGMLVLGRAYYDKGRNTLIYDIRFPEREVWAIRDTSLFMVKGEKTEQTRVIDQYNQSTIFHKILEGQLSNYGLQGSVYAVDRVERDGELVITTWKPSQSAPMLGTILTSTLNNQLYGVVFMDAQGAVIGRQLFKDYVIVRGLSVPTGIIRVFYRDTGEEYQVYSLSNIVINNPGNESKYNYPLPGM